MATPEAALRCRSSRLPASLLSSSASANDMTHSNRFIRIAWLSAYLGMGDVLSLIEEVQSKVDQSEAEEQLKKLQKNEFTLDDFRSQLRQVKKLGSFSKIMKLLPDQLLGGMGMPQLNEEQSAIMEQELKRTEAIIDSMTMEEETTIACLTQIDGDELPAVQELQSLVSTSSSSSTSRCAR